MDVSLLIRHRLSELGLDQKDLAAAAQVTESYISQLLARKKAPPAPARTDIYDKIGEFLKLPHGELAKLAELQRRQELKRKVAPPPPPLFGECRRLILRKCSLESVAEVQTIFEKEPFGELERLVTQKLLDVVQAAVREELRSEERLRSMAQLSGHTFEQMRVSVLEFLDTDIYHVSIESCVLFLDPAIESWDINLKTFGLEVMLDRRLTTGGTKRFEFLEKTEEDSLMVEPGFERFLKDPALSGDATKEELDFLRALKLKGRHPAPIYYYRELQNLRDPLHFPALPQATDPE